MKKTNTKKMLIAASVAILLCSLLIVMGALHVGAADGDVATVTRADGTAVGTYQSFEDAVAAWTDGTTLTLHTDVAGTGEIMILNRSVTLDLNGHTYSRFYRLFDVKEGATLTVTDSSAERSGALRCTKENDSAIFVYGTLNVAGGTISTEGDYCATIYATNGATVNISGGIVEYHGAYRYAVSLLNSAANITGGKIDSVDVQGSTLRVGGDAQIDIIECSDNVIVDFSTSTNADGFQICSWYEQLTVGTNVLLPAGMELQVDTLPVEVLEPCYIGTVSHPHSGGTASCDKQAICETCEKPYGTTPAHNFVGDTCNTCNQQATISVVYSDVAYYAMDAASLQAAVTAMLSDGERSFTVNLPADASAKLFTAIRRALLDAENVNDGSVHLTIAGATAIPAHNELDPAAAIFGNISYMEYVSELASVRLPDALSIGDNAFSKCYNLRSFYAPKVQTVGENAFAHTAIGHAELPEATTIGPGAFKFCSSLNSVSLPRATSIGYAAFQSSNAIVVMELSAQGAITFGEYVLGVSSTDLSSNIKLFLFCDKKSEVTGGTTWNGYTFQFIGWEHGTEETVHDGSKACSECHDYERNHSDIAGSKTESVDTRGTYVTVSYPITNPAAFRRDTATITLVNTSEGNAKVTLGLFNGRIATKIGDTLYFDEQNTVGYMGAELVGNTLIFKYAFPRTEDPIETTHTQEVKYSICFSDENGEERMESGTLWLPYVLYGMKAEFTEQGILLYLDFCSTQGTVIRTGLYNGGEYSIMLSDYYGNTEEYIYLVENEGDRYNKVTREDTANGTVIKIESVSGARISVMLPEGAEGVSVTGNNSSRVTVTATEAVRFYYEYMDANGDTYTYYITVDEPSATIGATLLDRLGFATVDWSDAAQYALALDGVTKYRNGNVTVYLNNCVFKTTGNVVCFTFTPGAPTSHTFSKDEILLIENGEEIELNEDVTVSLDAVLLNDHGFLAATCTEAQYCKYCGGIGEEALGHLWDNGKLTSAPSCTGQGEKTYTCQHDAAHTYTESVNATGHAYDNDCDALCNTCNAERAVAAHADANKDHTCDCCGAALPHEEESGGAATGIVAGIVAGSVAVVGIGGFAVFWFVIKKKKHVA